MLLALVGPRYVATCRRGAAVGALCGLAGSAGLYWYFARGPAAASVDAGEAYGYLAGMMGAPISFIGAYFGVVGLVISVAAMWSVVGAIVAGVGQLIARRVRATRDEVVPPAA